MQHPILNHRLIGCSCPLFLHLFMFMNSSQLDQVWSTCSPYSGPWQGPYHLVLFSPDQWFLMFCLVHELAIILPNNSLVCCPHSCCGHAVFAVVRHVGLFRLDSFVCRRFARLTAQHTHTSPFHMITSPVGHTQARPHLEHRSVSKGAFLLSGLSFLQVRVGHR